MLSAALGPIVSSTPACKHVCLIACLPRQLNFPFCSCHCIVLGTQRCHVIIKPHFQVHLSFVIYKTGRQVEKPPAQWQASVAGSARAGAVTLGGCCAYSGAAAAAAILRAPTGACSRARTHRRLCSWRPGATAQSGLKGMSASSRRGSCSSRLPDHHKVLALLGQRQARRVSLCRQASPQAENSGHYSTTALMPMMLAAGQAGRSDFPKQAGHLPCSPGSMKRSRKA